MRYILQIVGVEMIAWVLILNRAISLFPVLWLFHRNLSPHNIYTANDKRDFITDEYRIKKVASRLYKPCLMLIICLWWNSSLVCHKRKDSFIGQNFIETIENVAWEKYMCTIKTCYKVSHLY